MDYQRWYRQLAKALPPSRIAIETSEHHTQLIGHLHWGTVLDVRPESAQRPPQ